MGEMADLYDYGCDPDEIEHIVFSRTITCKYCGRDGYHWDQDENDKWRLYTRTGRLHSCSKWSPK